MLSLRKLRAGRVELAVCLLGPLLIVALVAIPGRVYCRHLKHELDSKEALLARLPEAERKLAHARKTLGLFMVKDGGDAASELTLAVNQAAQAHGITSPSVHVEKQTGAETDKWTDYRVAVTGEGTLKSVIGMLDFLEAPQRTFSVGRAALQAKGLDAETPYEVSIVLMSRALSPIPAGGVNVPAQPGGLAKFDETSARVAQLVGTIEAYVRGETRVRLDLGGLDRRKPKAATEIPTVVETELSLKLNGIVKDAQRPLALTDRGVLGVGDEVDGFKVVGIANDRVELVNRRGQRTTVTLYGN